MQTQKEMIQVQGGQLLDQLKRLVHEGNVRRIVIKQDERTVAEFPVTIGVVGVMLAPVFAAVGALVALLTDCTIEIERDEDTTITVTPPVSEPVVIVPIMTAQPVANETTRVTEPIGS